MTLAQRNVVMMAGATEPPNPTDPPMAHHDRFQVDVGAPWDDDSQLVKMKEHK